MENKQEILDKLVECLKLTRQYSDDLLEMKYRATDEIVEVVWHDPYRETERTWSTFVNVAMDSGAAMLRDVLSAIR